MFGVRGTSNKRRQVESCWEGGTAATLTVVEKVNVIDVEQLHLGDCKGQAEGAMRKTVGQDSGRGSKQGVAESHGKRRLRFRCAVYTAGQGGKVVYCRILCCEAQSKRTMKRRK